jgi:hypothetical protein
MRSRSGHLFLCYRRDDTQDAACHLYDRLVDRLGENQVFMDITDVPLGVNFVTHIRHQVEGCAAVLAMIGRNWLDIKDSQGNRRLEDPRDHVRLELATAFKHGIPIIPILVQNASMPGPADLPQEIRELAFFNGIRLTPEFWRAGVEKLIKDLNPLIQPQSNLGTRVAIRAGVKAGTARMGASGLTATPSADLVVYNDGDPFQLVAHARLLRVSAGYEWAQTDEWEYEPRLLKGGDGKTWYHIATVNPASERGRQSIVGVRAEHMFVIRKWEAKEWQAQQPLWFDVEWRLYNDVNNSLRHLDTVVVRVTLKESPSQGFDVTLL